MPAWIFVFLGGGFGSVARWSIGRWLAPQGNAFPIGTFVANITACIVLGLLMGYHLKHPIAHHHKLLLMIGFCGGFSTFSTFSAEILNLLKSGNHYGALIYVTSSLLVGVLAIFMGIKFMS